MDIMDEGIKEKTFQIKIGKIPSFITPSTIKENLVSRLPCGKDVISVELQSDPINKEENICIVSYRGDDKLKAEKQLQGKILTVLDEKMHCMYNVTGVRDGVMHQDVRKVLQDLNVDLVLLVPNKSIFD
jgi:hypothetical protein